MTRLYLLDTSITEVPEILPVTLTSIFIDCTDGLVKNHRNICRQLQMLSNAAITLSSLSIILSAPSTFALTLVEGRIPFLALKSFTLSEGCPGVGRQETQFSAANILAKVHMPLVEIVRISYYALPEFGPRRVKDFARNAGNGANFTQLKEIYISIREIPVDQPKYSRSDAIEVLLTHSPSLEVLELEGRVLKAPWAESSEDSEGRPVILSSLRRVCFTNIRRVRAKGILALQEKRRIKPGAVSLKEMIISQCSGFTEREAAVVKGSKTMQECAFYWEPM